MSQDSVPAGNAPAAPAAPASSAAAIRLVVLVALLVMVVGAYVYDRFYIIPTEQAAWEKVEKVVETKNNTAGKSIVTPKQVHQMIGRTPSRTNEKTETKQGAGGKNAEARVLEEYYVWRRGVPVWTFFHKLTYDQTTEGYALRLATRNEEEHDALQPDKGEKPPAATDGAAPPMPMDGLSPPAATDSGPTADGAKPAADSSDAGGSSADGAKPDGAKPDGAKPEEGDKKPATPDAGEQGSNS